jgi:hypothetical protein
VRGRNPQVEEWAASVPVADEFATALTISELERGVIAKERCLKPWEAVNLIRKSGLINP